MRETNGYTVEGVHGESEYENVVVKDSDSSDVASSDGSSSGSSGKVTYL